ncbi:hypothetical protein HY251_06100 [bacterium]|nr:hypothetical protein [bacterium]
MLERVLARASEAGSAGVVAFDLDSTLLDNSPRQATLLREWAEKRGGPPELLRVAADHLDGWDLRVAMRNAGLSPEAAEELYPDAKGYWRAHFFTSEYCKLDVPIDGTAPFLERLRATRSRIAYVTGRHEAMRAGTLTSFERAGFPLPDDAEVFLLLKPTSDQDDDAWKREAYARLGKIGRVVAAFDNEPIHVNGYKQSFPDALVVHVDTDHSGRPVPVLESIPSVLDFVL